MNTSHTALTPVHAAQQHSRTDDGKDATFASPAPPQLWTGDGTREHPTGGYVTARRDHHSGTVEYVDAGNQRHRLDGPAVITVSDTTRTEVHFVHGVRHSSDGPAFKQWSRLPRGSGIDEVAGFWRDGHFERAERVRYTDQVAPGDSRIDGLPVTVKPVTEAPNVDFTPPLLPMEDPEEAAHRRDTAARLRAAVEVAAVHPVMRAYVSSGTRPVPEPSGESVTLVDELRRGDRAAAVVDARIEDLRSVATWRLEEAAEQVGQYEAMLARSQPLLEKVLWGRGVTQLTQERLTYSRGMAAAAKRILNALDGTTS